MTRVSIITHDNTANVLVREGKYCVGLSGERPWPLLFKAVAILKYRETVGYFHNTFVRVIGDAGGIKHLMTTIRHSING